MAIPACTAFGDEFFVLSYTSSIKAFGAETSLILL